MESFMMVFALAWGAFSLIYAIVREVGFGKFMDYVFLIAVFALPLALLYWTFFGGCNSESDCTI